MKNKKIEEEKNSGWLCPKHQIGLPPWRTICPFCNGEIGDCDLVDDISEDMKIEDLDGFDYTEYCEWDKCWYAYAKSGFSCKSDTEENARKLLEEKLK